MENVKKVFLIGPGFIGADVLDLLVHNGFQRRRADHTPQRHPFDAPGRSHQETQALKIAVTHLLIAASLEKST